jgi:hypothetical protein
MGREISIAPNQPPGEAESFPDPKSLWHSRVNGNLAELRTLRRTPPDDHSAVQPTAAALASAFSFVESIDVSDPPLPQIVPGAHGSLQFEWECGPRELYVRFERDGTGSFVKVDRGISSEEANLPPSSHSLMSWLINR